MPISSLSAAWNALPPELAAGLLRDSSGQAPRLRWSLRLLEIAASSAAREGVPLSPDALRATLRHACDLLSAAWEAAPEDRDSADRMLALHRSAPFLSATQVRQLTALRACDALPEAPEPHSWPAPIRFLGHWRAGLRHWREGSWVEALTCFRAVDGGWLTPLELSGHCLHRLGRADEAFAIWRRVLAARPWHVNLIVCAASTRPCLRRNPAWFPLPSATPPCCSTPGTRRICCTPPWNLWRPHCPTRP